jgi:hypothetical protein
LGNIVGISEKRNLLQLIKRRFVCAFCTVRRISRSLSLLDELPLLGHWFNDFFSGCKIQRRYE